MKKYKNFVLTTVGEGADVYRVFVNNSGVQFDYNALNTIINNRIAGLVPIACRGNEIGYNIRGLVSLSEMIKEIKRCQAKSALYRLIANTSFVAAGIEQFGLNPDKLIFDPNDMYVDPNTMNVYLLYYPLINVETDTINACIDNIIEIFKSNLDAPVMACYDKTQEKACETEIQKESDGMVNVQPGCDKEIIEETVQEEIVEEAAENVIPDDNIKDDSILDATNTNGETVVFEKFQSDIASNINRDMSGSAIVRSAYIIRKKTGEKIYINTNIFKIGKDRDYVNYCVDENSAISRSHADIYTRNDGYYITDNASLNHTYVNGVMLMAHQQMLLTNGSIIQLADEVFEFVC